MPLLPTAYFPSVSWLAVLWNHDSIELEACEHFQKGSFRNRCLLAGPGGVQRLSVPLEKGKHEQQAIRDVRIAYDEPWPRLHWRSIATAYGSAPYFEHYAADVAHFFEKRHTFLFDLNLEIVEFIIRKLGWHGLLQLTPGFVAPPAGPLDFRAAFSAKHAGAEQSWFKPVPYAQVFAEKHGFLPDLSALDLLFCRGKHGGEILRNSFVDN
jgi:hypothetical protein